MRELAGFLSPAGSGGMQIFSARACVAKLSPVVPNTLRKEHAGYVVFSSSVKLTQNHQVTLIARMR